MNPHATGSPEEWLSEHGQAMYRYALVRTQDEHRAEEAVQETLLAALQARDRFAGGASVRTWLIGILKHKIMDQFRRDARERPLDQPDELAQDDFDPDDFFDESGSWKAGLADWGDPEQALQNRQFLEILQLCLDGLPKRLARLFMLREVMEERAEKVCQDMGITPTNLWTMLYRARLVLRQCLDKNGAGLARE
ncbi:sigma-70 family RNA polymerase sigma factor [Thiobacillus sp.]|uniref:sigma-70 family RNA polymerase sigma factor n=1 Tax=Thiobacillus sp. TaxID=924 RepID=UPI0025DFE556|nr:sigma-70 family RNA polymerase sigma factor [Thiobacillus sp.]